MSGLGDQGWGWLQGTVVWAGIKSGDHRLVRTKDLDVNRGSP